MRNIEKLRLIKELVEKSSTSQGVINPLTKNELIEYLNIQIDIEMEYILDK